MSQIILFLISLGFGCGLKVLYFLQRLLAKKTNLYAVTVILDISFCAVAFFGFFLMSMFLAGGQFHFFMLAGLLAGFIAIPLAVKSK